MTAQAAAAANPIADPLMQDELVWSAITDAVPGTHTETAPTELGEHVYAAVRTATQRERNRIVGVIHEIAAQLMAKARADEQEATVARLQGNVRGANEVAARAAANGGIAQYLGRFLAIAVALPPGACRRCLGRKVVPSTLAPGQAVPCPMCAGPAAAPEGETIP